MSRHADAIRLQLAGGPLSARQLIDTLAISQPTLSRTLAQLGDGIVRLGAVFSLSALDAQFVGAGASGWPVIARRLAKGRVIVPQAADSAALWWAFGTLIGNTDMHGGNLSFLSDQGPPCEIAPAYDMSPMGCAPRSGGGLPESMGDATIDAGVSEETWRAAESLAHAFLARVVSSGDFSRRFGPCIAALERRIDTAGARIARLG